MSKLKIAVTVIAIVLAALVVFYALFVVAWKHFSDQRGKNEKVGILDSSAGAFEPDPEIESPLQFKDGAFKIAFITDIQDVYPLNATTKAFIFEVLRREKPDLVVLGGDNCVAEYTDLPEGKKENLTDEEKEVLTEKVKNLAIKELCDIFVGQKTYFTLVFGNHDHEQGMDDDHQLKLYQKYGGEYCLAYDPVPSLTGTATHNLTIKNTAGNKNVFNLWMFDSNEYEGGGDGAVCADQVEWYVNKSNELAVANGGKLPSFTFQHIVDHNVMDAIFYRAPSFAGNIGRKTSDATYWNSLKRYNNFKGFVHELVCCGYYDHGMHAALKENGKVLACFSGHDHICNYITNVGGIDYINTSACTFHAYSEDFLIGCRMIELDESDLTTYKTHSVFVTDYAKEDGSILNTFGDMTQKQAIRAERKRKALALISGEGY